MVNGSVQGQVAPAPVSSTPPVSPPSDEKLFKQSEINDIVGHAKHEAVERYKRSQDDRRYDAPPHEQQAPRQAANQQQTPAMTQDDFRRMAAEEAQRLMDKSHEDAYRMTQEQDAQRIASEFFTKLNTGKGKYEDFDKVTGDLELHRMPNVVQMANQVENTADVMYELGKNPSKIANLQQLMGISPKLAMAEMKRLSDSIKQNDEAANFKSPKPPLSQMKPSNIGTDTGGALTVSDYRRKYKV